MTISERKTSSLVERYNIVFDAGLDLAPRKIAERHKLEKAAHKLLRLKPRRSFQFF